MVTLEPTGCNQAEDALARLESQSYVLQAVEQHWPQKMATSQRPVTTRCLAPRCLDGVLPKEEMLRWVEPDCWGDLEWFCSLVLKVFCLCFFLQVFLCDFQV